MSTGVVSEFAGVVVVTNNLKICMSASLDARVNATAFTQDMLVAGVMELSGTRVTDSGGTLDSVFFGGRNEMLLNTQSINGL